MLFLSTIILALATSSLAWLPNEHKQIISRDGLNLFDRNSLYAAGYLTQPLLPRDGHGPSKVPIRGVNLGSLFVIEHWLANDIMSGWGCNHKSEFDCVSSLRNQALANEKFQSHWQSWVTADDFKTMVSFGLNTVRIPVGYWLMESLVDSSSEHFPQGGEAYLDRIVGWAKDEGLYVVIDLHGAPGGQVTDASTGQKNPNPGFYNDYNYGRACQFLEWMTEKIHTNPSYSTVGMLMLVNEPQRTFDTWKYPNAHGNARTLQERYYPAAWSHIRNKESSLGIVDGSLLHIQMMNAKWGSGNPLAGQFAAYDDHQYVKYVPNIATTKEGYLDFSCSDDRSGNWPVYVGEWSLSVNTNVEWTDEWNPFLNVDWYKQWWAAQVMAYEKVQGWIFWTWKTSGSLNDPRWDYQRAVRLGIISKNPDDAYSMGVCEKRKKEKKKAKTGTDIKKIGETIAKSWLTHPKMNPFRNAAGDGSGKKVNTGGKLDGQKDSLPRTVEAQTNASTLFKNEKAQWKPLTMPMIESIAGLGGKHLVMDLKTNNVDNDLLRDVRAPQTKFLIGKQQASEYLDVEEKLYVKETNTSACQAGDCVSMQRPLLLIGAQG